MSADAPTLLARLARRPLPILLGAAVGFLACCVAGRVAARQQPFKNFVRFHPGIAPESHYYPTFSQTLNLARQHAKPGTVLVIVGGNSVLYGVGQRAGHVWTARLQELLGEEFVVLNLAMRGAFPHEFAGPVAERLIADGVPVVFVTLVSDGYSPRCDWDGRVYRTFFWDGWGKGLIPPDARRDEWLRAGFAARHANDEQVREARRHGLVDGATYADDLWELVALRYRASVWTPARYPRFWRPHRDAPDPEPGAAVPFEAQHNEGRVADELRNIRGFMEGGPPKLLFTDEGRREVGERTKAYLSDALQRHALCVLRLDGRYFRDRMPADERARYETAYRLYEQALREAGLTAQLVGTDYDERDYADRSHFSEPGGRKMAEDVAPTIRAMAARLYGTEPKGGAP
jgi:lysophospholipase L1-like esterase